MLMANKPIGTIAYLGGVMTLPELFCWSWTQMLQYNSEYLCEPGQFVFYDRSTASYHSYARNSLVERMQGDWLLMLDTDHQFEPDLALRLLHRLNKYEIDVLVGLYQYKNPPYAPVLFQYNETYKGYQVIAKWDPKIQLFQIHSAGAGCLLVRKSVYQRIREELKENPFDIEHPFSEDHSFFNRLRRLNIRAYCDPSICANHLSVRPVTIEQFDRTIAELDKPLMVDGFI